MGQTYIHHTSSYFPSSPSPPRALCLNTSKMRLSETRKHVQKLQNIHFDPLAVIFWKLDADKLSQNIADKAAEIFNVILFIRIFAVISYDMTDDNISQQPHVISTTRK